MGSAGADNGMQGVRFVAGALGAVVAVAVVVGLAMGPRFDPIQVADADLYDPTEAGETLPSGYRRSLPRDAIAPVYEPRFVAARDSGWDDDTLVVGVALDGAAKAYPVSYLNQREMVIDSIAGIPILVTW